MLTMFFNKANLHKIYGKYEEKKVGVAGFEPATSSSQTTRDNRTTLYPDRLSGERGIRTLDTVTSITP